MGYGRGLPSSIEKSLYSCKLTQFSRYRNKVERDKKYEMERKINMICLMINQEVIRYPVISFVLVIPLVEKFFEVRIKTVSLLFNSWDPTKKYRSLQRILRSYKTCKIIVPNVHVHVLQFPWDLDTSTIKSMVFTRSIGDIKNIIQVYHLKWLIQYTNFSLIYISST